MSKQFITSVFWAFFYGMFRFLPVLQGAEPSVVYQGEASFFLQMTIASSVGGILGENLYTLKLMNTLSCIVLPPNFTLECCHTLCSHRYFFVTFPLQTWLIFPSVFSFYCHFQTLVSCFSYHKEITPDAILCILYFGSLLQLILFSTSGRKNPRNMTVARFASILVTDYQ